MASPQQEAMARQSGFRNYEEMLLWSKRRMEPQGGAAQPSRLPTSWDELKRNAMAWHPKNIFEYVANALKDANGD